MGAYKLFKTHFIPQSTGSFSNWLTCENIFTFSMSITFSELQGELTYKDTTYLFKMRLFCYVKDHTLAVHGSKVKVKLSLCLIIKHYAMKAYGGVDL
jgi:hypothetical protein